MPTHFSSRKTFSRLAPRSRHTLRALFALRQTQETSALQSQASDEQFTPNLTPIRVLMESRTANCLASAAYF